jgi:signal transduction histidine kinase/CheY-like chemotaxis protein/HPt (histidine-containing phosphotransfer) domain-containing protein
MKQILQERPKVIAIITVIAGIFVFILISLTSNFYLQSFIASNKQSENYYQAIKNLEEVKFYLSRIEGNERGYILSGNKVYIKNIESEIETINNDLRQIDDLLIVEADRIIFSKQKKIIQQKNKYVKDIIAIYKKQGMNSASNQFKTLQGFELMEKIVTLGDSLNHVLMMRIDDQYQEAKSFESKNKIWNIVAIILVAIIAIWNTVVLFLELDKRKLVNKELELARDKANQANEFKQRFMANMSHEIRTPMHAIVGFSELLLKSPLRDEQKEFVGAIRKSGENLLAIVNDVLDLSKVEAGMLQLDKSVFDLKETVNSVVVMFAEKVKEKKIHLLLNINDAIPRFVSGDSGRLSQILFNLVGNAIKFTHSGNVRLNIDLESIEAQKINIYFAVIDSGIGIKKEKLQSIFERFEQAESTTEINYGGTGLGLPIVKELVDLQGGKLSVYSILNVGSEFTFSIPFDSVDENSLVPEKIVSENADVKDPLLLNVLLVEDNVLNQRLAETVLKHMGCKVTLADDGLLAIEKLKVNVFDVILMDIQMPNMNGYEASVYIRQQLQLSIPIIALTSNVQVGEVEKCLSVGMNAYLPKPIKENDIRDAFSKIVEGKHSSSKNAANSVIKNDEMIIDLKYLTEISRGNDDFVIEMIDAFIEYNQMDLSRLETAIESDDIDDIKHIAHKMRSSVQYMGVSSEVEQLLYKIENFEIHQNFKPELINDFSLLMSKLKIVYASLKKEKLNFIQSPKI